MNIMDFNNEKYYLNYSLINRIDKKIIPNFIDKKALHFNQRRERLKYQLKGDSKIENLQK